MGMKSNRGPIGDWFFFVLTGVIVAACAAFAVIAPKFKTNSSTEDRILDLEMRCVDLENEIQRLKRVSSNHDMQILELENQ
jgi:hypothetical protein